MPPSRGRQSGQNSDFENSFRWQRVQNPTAASTRNGAASRSASGGATNIPVFAAEPEFDTAIRPAAFDGEPVPAPEADAEGSGHGSETAHDAHAADAGHDAHPADDHGGHAEHGGHAAHGGHDDHGGHGHLTLPPMMGTYSMGFGGNSISFPIDRLLVSPRGLTVPAIAGGAPLTANGAATATITRGGSSVTIQDLQTKYRLCVASPLGTAVGVIASPETFTSTRTVDQINAAFAATRQPYDIVTVVAPPAAYGAAVNTQFQAATTAPGTTIYDPTTSGAMRASATENALPVNGPVMAGDTFDALFAFDYVTTMSVPSPSADGLIGRTTIAANGTVLPTDRVFFDYALLNNSLFHNGNGSIDRFTFGVEKTLGEGHFSFEWRLPFGASVDNKVRVESGMGSDQVELGNALLILKQEIASSDTMAVTGGLGLSFPTGNDVQVANAAGSLLLDWHNDVVRLKPFLAAAYVPDEHWFFSGFMEYDLAAGSNEVQLNLYGTGLRNVGQVRDASHLFIDLQAGHWFEIEGWGLHRVAPTMELHFDRGMGDASVLSGPTYRITDISDNREYLNAVVGAVLDFSDNRYLSLGYGTGLGGDGSQSDGEFRAVLNLPFKSR